MHRYNQRLVEEMKTKQTQEKARLPKIQRQDAKTRMAMYKKSLRITSTAGTPEQEREKVKQVRAHFFHRLDPTYDMFVVLNYSFYSHLLKICRCAASKSLTASTSELMCFFGFTNPRSIDVDLKVRALYYKIGRH